MKTNKNTFHAVWKLFPKELLLHFDFDVTVQNGSAARRNMRRS